MKMDDNLKWKRDNVVNVYLFSADEGDVW